MDKSKLHFKLIYTLIIIQFCLIVFFAACLGKVKLSRSFSSIFDFSVPSEKYTLYIGTNDKDTYQREIPLEECRRRIESVCIKYTDGFSLDEIKGKWVDEAGILTEEDTVVCIFYGTTDEKIKMIMDEILVELNQNSILIEKEFVTSSFYNGK